VKLAQKKKLLGLVLGERSILIAEVASANKPRIEKVAEFVFPADQTLQTPALLGKSLGKFLKENKFSAGSAVAGLPIKWLLVKTKTVPPVTGPTLSNMLRLEAETEFSSELKDLVYEFAESGSAGDKTVLLMATQKKNVDAIAEVCEAARIGLVAVMPSALALSRATGAPAEYETLVLSLHQGGSEITAQQGSAASGMKHLRAAEPQPLFVSELRRTMTMLPGNPGGREMVLWNGSGGAAMDADSLSQALGFPVRSGELARLGIDAASATAAANGQSHKFAGAVALALAGMGDRAPVSDFLHSRLTPPSARRIPKWAILGVIAVIGATTWGILAYNQLQAQQAKLDKLNDQLTQAKPTIVADKAFVDQVALAWNWHSDKPRYLTLLRDLTYAVPDDAQTYVTTLTLREEPPKQVGTGAAIKTVQTRRLQGTLDGRAPDQSAAVQMVDQLNHNSAFSDAKLENTSPVARTREVTFQVTFTFDPDKAK
jgi:hypothetical protein